MIKINVTEKEYLNGEKGIYKIAVDGHALTIGEEPLTAAICAAVSTATLMTTNSLKFLSLDDKYVTSNMMSGHFEIATEYYDTTVDGLLENLVHTLAELQSQYQDHIELIMYTIVKEKKEENMTPEEALEVFGSIPLEDPVHPHLSHPMDEIIKIKRAYKILERALETLRYLQEEY